MNRLTLLCACAALGACQTPGAGSLSEIENASNWNLDDGDALAFRYQRDMRRLLVGRDIAGALGELRADGYECATGEAHEDHPDPMSKCKKSFATRACQLDWRVEVQAQEATVSAVETDFARDCVGDNRDYPEAKRSAIDDQLAPAKP